MATATFTHGELSATAVAELLAGRGFEVAEPESTTRTVLDSFDGRLHGAGLRLEFHTGHDKRLVLAAAGSVTASVVVDTQPRLASDLPAGPFRPRLRPALEMRALLPSISFTDVATNAVVRDGADKSTVLITIHEPIKAATAGGPASPFFVEVTEMVGHRKTAAKAHRLLAELGFERADTSLVDSVMTAAGVDPAGYNSSPSVPLDPAMSAISGFRAVFENLSETITANWHGTLDDVDTEFLHELRVAIRRTRSLLGHGKGVLPDEVRQRYRDEFAWLANLTGATRDLDVYILEWSGYVGQLSKDRTEDLLPVLLHLQQHRENAFREMVENLKSDRAQALIAAWAEMLRHPEMGPEAGPNAHRALHRVVTKRLRDADQTLIDNGRLITPDSPAEALHDLRKDAKKLRYAIECFGGLLPGRDRKAFVRQLKGLQDNLGQHQDAEVHSDELQAVAKEMSRIHTKPDTLIALGQLTAHLEQEQHSARSEFAQRFATYDSTETRTILTRMLESIGSRS